MHVIGNNVFQQTLVVSNNDERALGRTKLVNTVSHNTQSVNVEAGVCLIQYGQAGLQHSHLENLITLLLTPRKAFVK
ncbi:hypothetical protein D9M69_626510 [compost metagenome]